MSDVEVALLIRAAKPERDRLMLQVAYYGGLRVSELAALTWRQVLPRKTGEVQLAVVGKGDKPRHVLIPAHLAELLLTMRAGQKPSARVFPLTDRRINYIVKSAAKRAGVNPAVSVHWLRHAHASPRDRRGRSDYPGLADARTCGSEDHKRLCARKAGRLLEPVFEADNAVGTNLRRFRHPALELLQGPIVDLNVCADGAKSRCAQVEDDHDHRSPNGSQ